MPKPFAQILGMVPIINRLFIELGLKSFFEEKLEKLGPNVKISSSDLVTALIGNLLNCAAESMYAASEFYNNRPTKTLFGCNPEDINRHVTGRLLDKIFEYGCPKLFFEFTGFVYKKLNIKATVGHMDTTSFHYHGNSFDEEGAILITQGYSRDSHPELKQYGSNMIVDESTNLPIGFRPISGNKSDKTEFCEFIEAYNLTLKTYHSDLKYFVEDSAGMTDLNINALKQAGYYLVTRIPDTYTLTKESYKVDINKFEPIYPDEKDSPLGYFMPEDMIISDNKFKAFCVYNPNMISKKRKTVMRKAKDNLEKAQKVLKELKKQEFDSQEEAEKCFSKKISKIKFIKIESVSIEKITKNKPGRPKTDGSSVIIKFKVDGNVSLNQQIIDKEIDMEVRHTIITTDIERKWTMQDLYEIYHHQQKVERGWRTMKSPRFFVDSTFLKNPSRIEAFLWLMTMGLFILTLLTNKIQKIMKENNLTIPSPSKESDMTKPTAQRLAQYIHNMKIIVAGSKPNEIEIFNLEKPLENILKALGPRWIHDYEPNNYKAEFFPLS